MRISVFMDKYFWPNKKVLITGSTGFKGSWLTTMLYELGADIYGYALQPNTTPSMFRLLSLDKKINFQIGDIRDLNNLSEFINKINPEIVFHLAAQPLVLYSYQNPIETYHTNVLGLVNLLEVIRHNKGIKAVINVTSDKCYENKEWVWGYRENEPMGGYDPYSNSKGCAELVTACYQKSYFNINEFNQTHSTLLASARAGNVIGGGDWASNRLIPDMIKSVLNKEIVRIRNPYAIRPWQHVVEPLSGYLTLAKHLYNGEVQYSSPWNFGPNLEDAKPVEYIISRLCNLWGDNANWQLDINKNYQHEANYLKLDCSKANNILHWHPKWNLDTTLDKIIQWYKVYQQNGDLYQITKDQIYQYMELGNE
jgi:CDP-glucose 4,6-dehydratase